MGVQPPSATKTRSRLIVRGLEKIQGSSREVDYLWGHPSRNLSESLEVYTMKRQLSQFRYQSNRHSMLPGVCPPGFLTIPFALLPDEELAQRPGQC